MNAFKKHDSSVRQIQPSEKGNKIPVYVFVVGFMDSWENLPDSAVIAVYQIWVPDTFLSSYPHICTFLCQIGTKIILEVVPIHLCAKHLTYNDSSSFEKCLLESLLRITGNSNRSIDVKNNQNHHSQHQWKFQIMICTLDLFLINHLLAFPCRLIPKNVLLITAIEVNT